MILLYLAIELKNKTIKQIMIRKRNLETICIHGGWQPKKGEPQQLPIYQSKNF